MMVWSVTPPDKGSIVPGLPMSHRSELLHALVKKKPELVPRLLEICHLAFRALGAKHMKTLEALGCFMAKLLLRDLKGSSPYTIDCLGLPKLRSSPAPIGPDRRRGFGSQVTQRRSRRGRLNF